MDTSDARANEAAVAPPVTKTVPMFNVADMRATLAWYESIGFTVEDRHDEDGEVIFARLSFGAGEFTLSPGGNPGPRDVTLWFFTSDVERLYRLFRSDDVPRVTFAEELYEPFYGGRQFSICDINGLNLIFWQPSWLVER
jgi:hypothetical protein